MCYSIPGLLEGQKMVRHWEGQASPCGEFTSLAAPGPAWPQGTVSKAGYRNGQKHRGHAKLPHFSHLPPGAPKLIAPTPQFPPCHEEIWLRFLM